MVVQTKIQIRPVKPGDKNQLAHLIHFGTYVHRHLDWKPPLEWIGEEPFFVAESSNRVVSALACPPTPPEVAWVRMFVCSTRVSYNYAWDALWPQTIASLQGSQTKTVAAIPLQKWFRELLTEQGFHHNHNVVAMAWDSTPEKIASLPLALPVQLRRMTKRDIPAVSAIDAQSFTPLWRNGHDSIDLAFKQSINASVVEESGEIIGYQITTHTPYGAHLGRLAVSPGQQNKGIGYALLRKLVSELSAQNIQRLSVNTQNNNVKSIGLYKKAGFIETNEAYPVFIQQLE
ncbi:MAG: GNAT family N-acetyltransferase [Chloroflexota bacterium]